MRNNDKCAARFWLWFAMLGAAAVNVAAGADMLASVAIAVILAWVAAPRGD